MGKGKRNFLVFLLIFINLFLNGCWSYSEIDERLIVGSVGIDYGSSRDRYKVSIRAVSAKPSPQGVETVSEVITLEGKSVFEVIRRTASIFGRKTYWSHLKSIIVSEELAREDMLSIMDFFFRDAEVRQDSMVYVASGVSPEEILKLEAFLMESRGYYLRYAAETQKFTGAFPKVDLLEFTRRALDETVEPVLPIVNIHRDEEEKVKIEGTAVFYGSKLVGKLNREDSLMVQLIRNEANNSLVVMTVGNNSPSSMGPVTTLEIYDAKSKVKSNIKHGNISIVVEMKLDVGIGELNYNMDYLNEKDIEKLEKISEEEIKLRVLKTLNILQQKYRADVLGFGKSVEIKDPKLWKDLKDDWGKIFSNLSVDVKVKVNIMSTGKPSASLERRE